MLVYFLNVLPLWSLCVAQFSEISQPVSFQTVKLGESALVECYIKSKLNKRGWYKLTTGKRIQLVAEFDTQYNRSVLSNEFQHFSVKFDNFNSHLSMSTTRCEDVGTYYCGVMNLNNIQYGSGTFLMLKGTKMISDSVSQQPEYRSVYPGDSVNLSCSVHTDHSRAEHISVMWLKNSDHSAPEMVYSSKIQNTCQKAKNGSVQTTCVYSLIMTNLSSEDAGTYFCVATSCGEILFGKGTRVNTHMETAFIRISPTVIGLMLSNIVLGLVTLTLVWTLFKSRRKESTDTGRSFEGNQTSDAVTYSAVCPPTRSLPPRQTTVKYSKDSVIYSDIKYCQQNQ
ncbi:signal-regulatory protein beta-2-like [Channa argus]|uniref:signal-regulatory protein beta-2-like n=1 Tax=Channa argus TaxID=215402 RepID=UPI00352126EE